jgi:hypothetical protein
MPGPDLPPPHEPIDVDVYEYRWPTGAEKVELWDGCPLFSGFFDERDVQIAERAYPGRIAVIHPHTEDEPGIGNLMIKPAPEATPS